MCPWIRAIVAPIQGHTRSHCSHNGRTCISLSLLSNFLWMGPWTISCFHLLYLFDLWPSHCLSWVQKNIQIYRLSPVEEGIKNASMPVEVSLQSWTDSKVFCSFWIPLDTVLHFGRINGLGYAGSSFLFDLLKFCCCCCVWLPSVFELPAFFHHMYWLLFFFLTMLAELVRCFK